MLVSELEKRQALIELLAMPDTPDLRRGHHLTIEGRADRHEMLRDLTSGFIQRHLMELEDHESSSTREPLRLHFAYSR